MPTKENNVYLQPCN